MTKQQIKDKVKEEFKNFCKHHAGCKYCEYYPITCKDEFYTNIIADLTIKLESKEEVIKE